MADLRAYVANCLMAGDSYTRTGNYSIRDSLELECEGQVLVFKQHSSVATGAWNELKDTFCRTTEILVRDVRPSQISRVLSIIDRVCWLLSFAGMSKTLRYGYDYPDGQAQSQRQTVAAVSRFFRPTIEIRDGAEVKSFVEQTYDTYARLEKSRKLNVAIDYLLQADQPNLPTECRLIFSFVLLENLKDTFARYSRIPYVAGFYRKGPRARDQRFTFEELLHAMFKEVGMKRGLKRVVKLRNEILHSGLSQKSHGQLWSMYERVHDLLREYLLRLLGFRGSYLTYSSAGTTYASL